MSNRRLVVGRHSVMEALRVRPQAISKLYFDDKLESKKWAGEIKDICSKQRISIQKKKESFFKNLSSVTQGVACEVTEDPSWPDMSQDKVFLLALDKVEDPHNLGAIIRTAWLAGVDGILLPSKESVGLTPTVTKIASGGLEHVPIAKVKNLKNEIKDLKDNGFWSYALDYSQGSQEVGEVVKSEKTILIAGSEEKGIRPTLLEDSDFKIFLKQKNAQASYNVSVAVALGIWSLK